MKTKDRYLTRSARIKTMKPSFIPCHSVCSVVNGRLLSAQRDSGISILGVGLMRVIGLMGLMRRKQKSKNGFPQRDSKMSNPVLTLCLCASVVKRLLPAQRDSGISKLGILRILRSLGILGWKNVRQRVRMKTENHKTKTRPAQRDSGISKLAGCSMGIMRSMGKRHKTKNSSAQRDSKMSNERWQGGQLHETSPAQQDSGNSKLAVAQWE